MCVCVFCIFASLVVVIYSPFSCRMDNCAFGTRFPSRHSSCGQTVRRFWLMHNCDYFRIVEQRVYTENKDSHSVALDGCKKGLRDHAWGVSISSELRS